MLHLGSKTGSVCQATYRLPLCGPNRAAGCGRSRGGPPFFSRSAAGTSRLINSQPTGESAAAEICMHLSEPGRPGMNSTEGKWCKWHSCARRHAMMMMIHTMMSCLTNSGPQKGSRRQALVHRCRSAGCVCGHKVQGCIRKSVWRVNYNVFALPRSYFHRIVN